MSDTLLDAEKEYLDFILNNCDYDYDEIDFWQSSLVKNKRNNIQFDISANLNIIYQ